MEQSIASYLFRNNSCILSGIGELKIIKRSADTDFINKQIKSPEEIIEFYPNNGKLVFNELTAISEHLRMLLDTKRTVLLNGIGTFSKDDKSVIHFTGEQLNTALTQPVYIERVIRHETKADVTASIANTAIVQNEFIQNEKVVLAKKDRWWIAAIIIAIMGLAILLSHIVQNGATSGNAINIKAGNANATYHTIK